MARRPDRPTHLRALGPRTIANYERVLARAYGEGTRGPYGAVPAHVMDWPEGSKDILRNALIRAWSAAGDPDRGRELAASIPASHRIRRVGVTTSEEVLAKIEEVIGATTGRKTPRGLRDRALILIPLRLGLRSEEFLSLTRGQVEAAIKTGTLTFVRKGAREATLPAKNVREFFSDLLKVPAAKAKSAAIADPEIEWDVLGEVLAGAHATYPTRYNLFNRLVKRVGAAVGVPELSPHRLRHGFATRMHRDGAPMKVVQRALGHSSVQTTERYVHVDDTDVEKWVRK